MIDNLPIELLITIFDFLSLVEKNKATYVSKKFRNVIKNTHWQIKKFHIKYSKDVRILHKFKPFIGELVISDVGWHHVNPKILNEINYENLTFREMCFGMDFCNIDLHISKNCKGLTIDHCRGNYEALTNIFPDFKHCESIKFVNMFHYNVEGNYIPKLKYLRNLQKICWENSHFYEENLKSLGEYGFIVLFKVIIKCNCQKVCNINYRTDYPKINFINCFIEKWGIRIRI